MNWLSARRSRGLLVPFIVILGLFLGCGSGSPPPSQGGPVAMRRLTEAQYRRAVADVFGAEIEIVGRFEPDHRREGLIAVGSAFVTVTPSGFEQYEAMATYIARQVVSEAHRKRLIPCEPRVATAPDAACTEAFLRRIGPPLLRRPLAEEDVAPRVASAEEAARLLEDFYAGLELVVTSLLVAPDFLFRIEVARPGDAPDGPLLLTDTTLASRLSYLLWNSGPDEALRAAAAEGRLSDPQGLAAEVDRMLASPRLKDGVRALFEDIFRFDEFESLSKDPIRYPIYSAQVAEHAREQTLRVVVDHLITSRGDYRELFTTRRSFMTRALGPVYAVPVRAETGWEEMHFADGDPRAGLLSHASLNMLHAHPGRSSATLRGVFLRESLLCQNVPAAPADVDFGLFNEDDNPEFKTARDRLGAHSSEASCRNCHKLTDPIGLGLEIFDGIGRYRTTEDGALIDTSGELDGRHFANNVELGEAFRDSPLVGACLVENVYRYAVGRDPGNAERRLLRYLERRLEASGYRLDALLHDVATSEGFRTATRPSGLESEDPPTEVAALESVEEAR